MFFGFLFVVNGNECDLGIGKCVIFGLVIREFFIGLRGEFKCFLLILGIFVGFVEELGDFVFCCMFKSVEVIFKVLGFVFFFVYLDVEVIFKVLGFV